MNKEELKREEVKKRLSLAQYYQEAVTLLLKERYYRQAADIAYNAAELCAKGMILLKQDNLPKKHSGVVQIFSKFYVKTGDIDKDIGRLFHQSLDIRNNCRYVSEADITKEMVHDVYTLAGKLIKILEEKLK